LQQPAALFFLAGAHQSAKFTRQEILYLGLFQIVWDYAALFLQVRPVVWALGFGVRHIIVTELSCTSVSKTPQNKMK
jgi:hypothetical protein